MQSAEIRQQFFDFFKSKGHTIVPSAPYQWHVVKAGVIQLKTLLQT